MRVPRLHSLTVCLTALAFLLVAVRATEGASPFATYLPLVAKEHGPEATPTVSATPIITLTPTQTQTPTVTPTPTPTVPGALYLDDFSNPGSGWLVDDDPSGSHSYQDGEYEIRINYVGWGKGVAAPYTVTNVNYAVQADMRHLAGSIAYYGLVFNRQDWDNYYSYRADP